MTKIFVSHSSQDQRFCRALVRALRDVGEDVWFDEQNLGPGQLAELIQKEISERLIFIVVLSKAALASHWVKLECTWSFTLYQQDSDQRIILPVTAGKFDLEDLNGWLFLRPFLRVEDSGMKPLPLQTAIDKVLDLLALTPVESNPTPSIIKAKDSAEELLVKGHSLLGQGRFNEAIIIFRRVVQINPIHEDAWMTLGSLLGRTGQYEEAIVASTASINLNPRQEFAFNNLGLSLTILRRFDEAHDALQKGLAINPQNVIILGNLGMLLGKMKHHEEAIEVYRKSIKIDPDDYDPWYGIGVNEFKLKHYKRAISAYDHAIKLYPDDPDIWYNQGLCFAALKQYDDAIRCYNCALQISPKDVWSLLAKSSSLLKQKKFAEAISCVDHALAVDPSNPNVWLAKGGIYIEQGDYSIALSYFDRALTLDENYEETWQARSHALKKLNRKTEAQVALGRAREIGNKDHTIEGRYTMLGELFDFGNSDLT